MYSNKSSIRMCISSRIVCISGITLCISSIRMCLSGIRWCISSISMRSISIRVSSCIRVRTCSELTHSCRLIIISRLFYTLQAIPMTKSSIRVRPSDAVHHFRHRAAWSGGTVCGSLARRSACNAAPPHAACPRRTHRH